MRSTPQLKHVWLLLTVLLLGGCGGVVRAPVINRDSGPEAQPAVSGPGTVARSLPRAAPRPAFYLVMPGDTLYSIAWRYGNDYRELARWNDIQPPYLIRPGERLRLRPPAAAPVPSRRIVSVRSPDRPTHEVRRAETPRNRSVSGDHAASRSGISWRWPTHGKLVADNTPLGKNGIDIAGALGQPIVASAGGKVVYSGSGLIGYGKLIIIKHNDVFLSAYAHNSKLLVKEGEAVKSGQEIAEMGRNGARDAELHFEIRRNGKPVDPLKYLPRQQ